MVLDNLASVGREGSSTRRTGLCASETSGKRVSILGLWAAICIGVLPNFVMIGLRAQEPAAIVPPVDAPAPKQPIPSRVGPVVSGESKVESIPTDLKSTEPLERQPYRISFHFECHPDSRIDEARRSSWLHDWQVLARRFVGAPWSISLASPSSPLLGLDLENPDPSVFTNVGAYDKLWIVQVDGAESGSGLSLTGREYDVATRRLGPLLRRKVESFGDAPRALLEFVLKLFSPTAVITGQSGGDALLSVRGAMIEPSSPIGRVVSKGTVFQPLRLVSTKKDGIVVRTIALTYLTVESLDGPIARCRITSAFRDPLTQRVAQANTLAAVGTKPGSSPLRLRFQTYPDNLPAAGYTLTARAVPDGQPRELGMTDRSGRIVLQPGFADGLVILRLLAGNVEPVRELPIMPGESSDERILQFTPLPLTVALEAKLDSLRDEVVDLVALRARLEARMEARLKGEDWTGLEEAIKEFGRLTPREEFSKRAAQIKDESVRQQAESKKTILTKTAQAQMTDVQAMIDRYLDDDAIKVYVEALAEKRVESVAQKKVGVKPKTVIPSPAIAAPSDAQRSEPEPAPKPAGSNPASPKAGRPKGAEGNPVPF